MAEKVIQDLKVTKEILVNLEAEDYLGKWSVDVLRIIMLRIYVTLWSVILLCVHAIHTGIVRNERRARKSWKNWKARLTCGLS